MPVHPAPFPASWTPAISKWNEPHSHHPEAGCTNPTTGWAESSTHPTLTQLCGFQGAAWLWGTDQADERVSLRADRHLLILNAVSSSVVPFRIFLYALVPTETWRQSKNVWVICSWLLGGEIWKMTLKQGYLDIPPLKKKKNPKYIQQVRKKRKEKEGISKLKIYLS